MSYEKFVNGVNEVVSMKTGYELDEVEKLNIKYGDLYEYGLKPVEAAEEVLEEIAY